MREPQLHTYVTDSLPDDHPLAWVSVSCVVCGQPLLIGNEIMADWVETGKGNYCFRHFFEAWQQADEVLDDPAWGLPD